MAKTSDEFITVLCTDIIKYLHLQVQNYSEIDSSLNLQPRCRSFRRNERVMFTAHRGQL